MEDREPMDKPEHMTVDTATGQQAPAQVSAERTRRIFGRIAERYDLFNQLSSLGIYKKWLRALVEETRVELAVAGLTGEELADAELAAAEQVGTEPAAA